MSDLTTLADVEAWLGLAAGCADEPLLARMITAASGVIEDYCSRQFSVQSYVETRDGDGSAMLMLRQYPVIAVASVMVGPVAVPAALAFPAPGWRLDGRRLIPGQ